MCMCVFRMGGGVGRVACGCPELDSQRERERETLLDVRRRVSLPPCLFLQEHETEYSMMQMVESSSLRKADPSQFELLKVLGQGSFGKASPYFLIEHSHFLSWSCPIHMD